LISKSSALDFAVIQERKAKNNLQAAEEKIKAQEQLLASTQKALSKREFSSSVVISSVVANAMALVKNHMPKFDTEIL
jgi:pantothenate kinase type III